MIVFKSIEIENFYSIEKVVHHFRNGIHKLVGKNGSGKTTISSAIFQCLYNKNPKSDASIDSTYNYITGKPYKITLTFLKEDVEYVICNDRAGNSITISADGMPITSKGIKAQLSNIQKIIGIDYATFVSIAYLNQNSMANVFDLTDSNNLVNKFFDIDLIKRVDKQLKVERRDGRKHLAFLNAQAQDIAKTIEALHKYQQEDVTQYQLQKSDKVEQLNSIMVGEAQQKLKSLSAVMVKAKEKCQEAKEPLIKLKAEYEIYKRQAKQLDGGVCPLCNSSVDTVHATLLRELEETEKQIQEMAESKKALDTKLHSIETKYEVISSALDSEIEVLKKGITLLNNKIVVIEEKNTQLEAIKRDKEKLIAKQLDLTNSINDATNTMLFIDSALGVIASGTITKQYVNTFIAVLNGKLAELVSYLDIPINVKVIEKEGSIIYVISKGEEEVPFMNLSSGERTRVSLVVLLGIIATLEILTNVQLNILIFDELLSVLDKEGVELFQQQLNTYRGNKNVLVVIHHDEIENSYFDTLIEVKKVEELTMIEVRE